MVFTNKTMSVVRRPAAMSLYFGFNQQPSETELARQTELKVESLKNYFKKHYQKISKDAIERKTRYDKCVSQLNARNFSKQENENFFNQFVEEESKITRIMRTKFKAERYERIRLIGRGGYGEVWLAADKTTSEIFALKVLKKANIIFNDQVMNVRSEREVLSISDNPWIVDLICSFQDEQYLYLVLEYVPGGDLMGTLIKYNTFPIPAVQFYVGELLLAMHSVHELGFVHRDLKPDNVLISSSGHIKLADFGLATNYQRLDDNRLRNLLEQLQDMIDEQTDLENSSNLSHQCRRKRSATQAASIDYAAPEMIYNQSPSIMCDFWSLGIIMYEMLYGFTPFASDTDKDTAIRIVRWPQVLRFYPNQNVSPEAIDLMKHLLCYEQDRYTYDQIIQHPFLNGFNFDEPFANKPPFIPKLSSPTDTSNFDEIEPMPNETGGNIPRAKDLQDFAFLGFTYKQRPKNKVLTSLEEFNS